MDNTIDPAVKNLVSAIGQAETGPSSSQAYSARGASGEFGRYQFMPETYKNYAQKYLGDPNAQPTVENQNKIAYSFVKEKKDAGYNPAQIASMWNAGEGKPDAYKENFKGVNNKGVAYDTPAYAAKVSKYYEQNRNNSDDSQISTIPQTPTVQDQRSQLQSQGQPVSVNPEKANPTFVGGIVRDIAKPFAQIGNSVSQVIDTLEGKAPTSEPFSGNYLGQVGRVGQGFDPAQGITPENIKAVKQSAGAGAEVASNFIGGGALPDIAETGLKGLLKKSIIKGAKEGAIVGGIQGTGQALEENKSLGGTLLGAGTGTIGGTLFGGLLGSASPLTKLLGSGTQNTAERVVGTVMGPSTSLIEKEKQNLKSALEDAFSEKTTLRKKNALASQYGVEPAEIFARYGAVPKIVDGKMDTTDIIGSFDDAIRARMGTRTPALEQMSQIAPTVTSTPISDFENRVMKEIQSDPQAQKKGLVQQYQNAAQNRLNDFKKTYGDTLTLNNLDAIRSGQGQLTKAFGSNLYEADASEYLARTARNLVEEKTQNTTLGNVNKEVRDLINAKGIAEAMNGTPIKYGKFSQWMARMVGSTIGSGSKIPIVGPLLGAMGGDYIIKAIQSNAFGGPMQRKILSYIGSDTTILDKLMQELPKNKQDLLMKEIQNAQRIPFLPAPKDMSLAKKAPTENIISLPGEKSPTTYEFAAQKINRQKNLDQLLLPSGKRGMIQGETVKLPAKSQSLADLLERKNTNIKIPTTPKKDVPFLPKPGQTSYRMPMQPKGTAQRKYEELLGLNETKNAKMTRE